MSKILIDEAVVRQALEWIGDPHTRTVSAGKMVSILIEALTEQPVQRCLLCNYQHGHAIGCKNNPVDIALDKMAENARELGLRYEQPAPAQPLTDEQIERIYTRYGGDMMNCARAIEREHGITGEQK